MSLFSLVQTHSIDEVLKPIAEKVCKLENWTEDPIDQSFPTIFSPARTVLEAVQRLAQAAQAQMLNGDEDVQKDMKPAYEQTLVAAQTLIEAARQIESSTPPVNCQFLHSATRDILEGSIKILLAWDEGEVRKIIRTAHWTKDLLKLVHAARSMRALVVCYNGFFEAMMSLINYTTQRHQDLIDSSKKEKLFFCLSEIRKNLPWFSHSMQAYVRNPDTKREKDKDNYCHCITVAIDGIIESVALIEEEDEGEENDLYNISESSDLLSDEDSGSETIAIHLKKVQDQLSSSQRGTSIGPQLDNNINTIIENSKMVARESDEKFRDHIHHLCEEVLSIRKDLDDHYMAVQGDPNSEEKRALFDKTVDDLCSKLNELDRAVANSVADQVAQTYIQPSAAIENLMGAIVTSSSPPNDEASGDSMDGLKQTVKVFRQHSRKLTKVAIHAAQGTLNRKRSKRIKKLTTQLDEITRKVVSAAIEVRNNPHDSECRCHLDELRREWAQKVKNLTEAIDEIINVKDFTNATEATIVDDMAKCRQATVAQNWVELETTVHDIEAKAKRLIDVSNNRTTSIVNSALKAQILEATNNLEQAVKTMTSASKRLMHRATDKQPPNEEELVESLQHVLTYIHQVQELLSNVVEPLENTVHATPTTFTAPISFLQSTSTPLEVWSRATPSPPPPLPPTSPPDTYNRQTLSPSDDWIRSSSFETSPSSFAPTNPSVVHGSDYPFYDTSGHLTVTTPTSHQPITYPDSLGGDNLHTPSYLGGTPVSWQQTNAPPTLDYRGKEKPPDSEHLLESYTVPLQDVVAAATKRDLHELHSKASILTAQTQKLSELAESAAANALNHDTARILNKKSAQLNHLTPRIIKAAEQLVDNEGDEHTSDTLEALKQQWTGHVNALLEASQDVNMPWSQTARRLVSSAKSREGLDKEVSHVNSQTGRMVNVASTTIRAATIEDAIGSTANLDHAQDPIVQEQIEKVRDQVENIKYVTPDFVSTAHKVAEGEPQEDRLHLLSHEWATTASVLMRGVDDITIGMSGPADTLMISANSNDATLLQQQAASIKRIADSMLTIAQDAVQGCNNEEQVQSVLETAEMLQKLSIELVECAHELAGLLTEKRGTKQHQIVIERGEVLRRDWAAKMHLLTAYIDDLTAGVAGPLDKLISVALQASRTDGMAKDHLMKQFEKKEGYFMEQLEEVNTQLRLVSASESSSLHGCVRCMGFLQDVSPHAIGAARSLATDPSSTKLDHFSYLRRQWAAKAQSFYSSLLSVSESTNVTSVISAFEDLLQGYRTTRSTPSTYKPKGSKWQQEKGDGSNVTVHQPKYYSTEDLEPPNYLPPRIPTDDSYLEYKPGGSLYPWTTDTSAVDDAMETSLNKSLVVAAKSLHDAVDEFEEEGNPLVSLARRMSEQMYQMAEFTCNRGKIKSMKEMITVSKSIAEDAKKIVHYADMISKHCSDKRITNDLQYCVKMIPTLSNQLNIIASVKFSTITETDLSRADKMLEKNAQNLMIAVVQTIKAAEAAYVKGLTSPNVSEDEDLTVIEWKKKKLYHRGATFDLITAKGLRRLKKDRHSSFVSQVLHSPHI